MYTIVPIFASTNPEEGGLYAVLYDGCQDNCLDELLLHLGGIQITDNDWDQNWLVKMVNKNWEALKSYPHYFTNKMEAISAIKLEAAALRKSLEELSRKGQTSVNVNLGKAFKPLDPDRNHNIVQLEYNQAAYKGKTPRFRHPLIRLYALRIEDHPNLFVVVGGGIKASLNAEDTKMLGPQLHRINDIGRALKANSVTIHWFDNQTFELQS